MKNPIEVIKIFMEIIDGEKDFQKKLLQMIDERNKVVLEAIKKFDLPESKTE